MLVLESVDISKPKAETKPDDDHESRPMWQIRTTTGLLHPGGSQTRGIITRAEAVASLERDPATNAGESGGGHWSVAGFGGEAQ